MANLMPLPKLNPVELLLLIMSFTTLQFREYTVEYHQQVGPDNILYIRAANRATPDEYYEALVPGELFARFADPSARLTDQPEFNTVFLKNGRVTLALHRPRNGSSIMIINSAESNNG
jgi:hypothetical protein